MMMKSYSPLRRVEDLLHAVLRQRPDGLAIAATGGQDRQALGRTGPHELLYRRLAAQGVGESPVPRTNRIDDARPDCAGRRRSTASCAHATRQAGGEMTGQRGLALAGYGAGHHHHAPLFVACSVQQMGAYAVHRFGQAGSARPPRSRPEPRHDRAQAWSAEAGSVPSRFRPSPCETSSEV